MLAVYFIKRVICNGCIDARRGTKFRRNSQHLVVPRVCAPVVNRRKAGQVHVPSYLQVQVRIGEEALTSPHAMKLRIRLAGQEVFGQGDMASKLVFVTRAKMAG